MPWHEKAMKDVTTNDTLREGGSNLGSVDFRMGQPCWGNAQQSASEYIGCAKPTQGTETSKYLVEEKITMIS